MPTHQTKRSAFHLSFTSSTLFCLHYSVLPWLYNPAHTPPRPFTELTPSHSADLIKCHFLREILNHPKVRWGSPFNFFWNSLCFSLVTHITFVHIYLGAHLVNILLPTGLCFMPPVMITALFPTLVQLLA